MNEHTIPQENLANRIGEAIGLIDRLRSEGARVHCITNTVAQNFTANVLLACGATPSMTVSPEEASHFTSRSDALLVNLGTLSDDRKEAVRRSLAAARKGDKPVVLDPVMCHVSPPRLAFARHVTDASIMTLRANALEVEALKAADALPEDVCVVETAPTDSITSGSLRIKVHNGHEWMASVTAVGCAQGALIAALCAKTNDPATAALAALLWTGISGEIAAANSSGPGSFAVNFIDTLHSITIAEIKKHARVS